jgi:hypothetical protein
MVLNWLAFIISAMGVIMIPAIALLFRGAIKWSRTEGKLDVVIQKVSEIVADKDKVHSDLYNAIREDRNATNRRLEYLERIWIEKGNH